MPDVAIDIENEPEPCTYCKAPMSTRVVVIQNKEGSCRVCDDCIKRLYHQLTEISLLMMTHSDKAKAH